MIRPQAKRRYKLRRIRRQIDAELSRIEFLLGRNEGETSDQFMDRQCSEIMTAHAIRTRKSPIDDWLTARMWAKMVAREFAEKALRNLVPNASERYFNHGDYTADYAEAIAEAERE